MTAILDLSLSFAFYLAKSFEDCCVCYLFLLTIWTACPVAKSATSTESFIGSFLDLINFKKKLKIWVFKSFDNLNYLLNLSDYQHIELLDLK